MLFSEPKIPQSLIRDGRLIYERGAFQCSSASRKFLNPISRGWTEDAPSGFSALQRAENSSIRRRCRSRSRVGVGFSALQRAENSSIHTSVLSARKSIVVSVLFSEPKIPQSAAGRGRDRGAGQGFSALQRAENSSIPYRDLAAVCLRWVSVLFSEPKIPQSRCPPRTLS